MAGRRGSAVVKKLLLCAAGLAVGAVLSELALAVLGIPKFYKFHTTPPQLKFKIQEDGRVSWTNEPSKRITFVYDGNPRGYFDEGNRVVHTTNALGFRGRECCVRKKADAVRIAFLGDSFTFGEGVRDEDVFPRRVEEYLNAGDALNRFECCNFGVSGYNAEQSLLLLKNVVIHYAPDAVVFCFVLNDLEPPLLYYDRTTGSVKRMRRETYVPEDQSDQKPPPTLLYRFRIAQLIWKTVNNKKISEWTTWYYHELFNQPPLWGRNRALLNECAAFCRSRNIRFFLTVFPLLYHLDKGYPFYDLHKKVEMTVSDPGVFIDLLPDFIGKKDLSLRVHPTDQHPNEIAHDLAARRISARLAAAFQDRYRR